MKKFGLGLFAFAAVLLGGCGGGGGGTVPVTVNLSGKVDGTAASGLSVSTGGAGTITVNSGQELEIDSSTPVTWSATLNGTVLTPKNNSTSVWDNVVSNPVDATVVLTATSTTDTTKSASITVTVKAQRFAASPVKAGDFYSYGVTTTNVAGTTSNSVMTRRVNSMNPDGSYVFFQFDASNTQTFTYNADASGSIKSYLSTTPGAVTCTYTPSQVRYINPSYVGLTYSGNYALICGNGQYAESYAVSETITAYEPVTVPAGTFNTLKSVMNTTVSNSTDTNVNGLVINETCWIDVVTTKNVKCVLTYNYAGTPPSTYTKTTTLVLNSYLKQ
jgi:hypothetical protein